MNYTIETFRDLVESLAEDKESVKTENLLETIPEKESDDVKAYRSLMFLMDYFDDNEVEEDSVVSDLTVQEKLWRARGEVENRAIETVVDRIEIKEEQDRPEMFQPTVIHDPVSKIQQRVTDEQKNLDLVDQNIEYMAREVLEAPL